MIDLDEMTLEKFKLWSANALRVFLTVRRKSLACSFDELAARAFCAWEENVEVDLTAEQKQVKLLTEYKQKLNLEGKDLPDPASLTSGWKGEKDGMVSWPSVYIMDISTFLKTMNSETLMTQLLNEYKVGKAYRYFSNEWVKEVFIHDISAESDFCFVKCNVTPSQSVRNKPYQVWVCIRKDTDKVPGGQVYSAHCNCVAGMLGSCNHIAGVLFRLEHATKTGKTKATCTEKLCRWSVPSRSVAKPKRAADLTWKKTHYLKRPLDSQKEAEYTAEKKMFTPLSSKQQKKHDSKANTRLEIHNLLKGEMPDSCFSLTMEKQKPKSTMVTEDVPSPPSLHEISSEVKNLELSHEEKKQVFLEKIQLTADDVLHLNQATMCQANSKTWKEQRKGRITASNFYRATKRAKSLRQDPQEDPWSAIVKLVMGNDDTPQTMAMKHGSALEPVAKQVYVENMRKLHSNFKYCNSGLTVLKDTPFIGASPDLLISCDCCGEGLCEIKCPESIKSEAPSPDNIPYLIVKDNVVSLKKNHPYYYQIQGQLGITARKYCDLFVFTYHGNFTLKVDFDSDIFQEIVNNCEWLWTNCILDRLLEEN